MLTKYNKEYHNHRYSAKVRGIAFIFTFDQWLSTWIRSGKIKQRGRRANQYCMARYGDKGSYEPSNVRIITNAENRAEMRLSKKTRALMRVAKLGKPLSKKHRAKISASNTGKKMSAEALKNMRISKLGRKNPMFGRVFSKEHRKNLSRARKRRGPFSAETREKIRQARFRYWKKWHEAQHI